MREISLVHFLHLDKAEENSSGKKAPPPPDSYYFEVVGGRLMYIIPDGQVQAGEMEKRIAERLQNLMSQIQEQLSNKPKP